MAFHLQPWQMLSVLVAGLLNEQQQHVIRYLVEENRVLREQLGKQRVLVNDDRRRRLAARGRVLGRRLLSEICTIVTADTVLRWHKQLIAMQYNGCGGRRPGGRGSWTRSAGSSWRWPCATHHGGGCLDRTGFCTNY